MTEPVVVLGATGNVGTALTRTLGELSRPVHALFHPDSRPDSGFDAHVEPFPGDFADIALLDRAMTGADAVFMLTPPSPLQPSWHRSIVGAAVRAGVRRIVKLSAFDSGPDSPLQMGRWHDDGEAVVRASGLDHVILRPQYFMQMQTGALRTAKRTGVLRGTARADLRMGFVDVRDIAEVAAVALTSSARSGEILIPTGPDAPSFDDLARMLSIAIDAPVRYEQRSEEEVRSSMPFANWPQWHFEDYLAIHGTAASDLVTRDVLEVTGRHPRSFSALIDEVVAD